MGTLVLVRNLCNIMNNVRTEGKFFDAFNDAARVAKGIHEQNGTTSEWCHLAQGSLSTTAADLGGDGEVELASVG